MNEMSFFFNPVLSLCIFATALQWKMLSLRKFPYLRVDDFSAHISIEMPLKPKLVLLFIGPSWLFLVDLLADNAGARSVAGGVCLVHSGTKKYCIFQIHVVTAHLRTLKLLITLSSGGERKCSHPFRNQHFHPDFVLETWLSC